MIDLRVVFWVLAGVLNLAISLAACYIAYTRAGGWKKAYRTLEMDVEGMWEKVESHLGRVSRLRRGNPTKVSDQSSHVPTNGEASASETSSLRTRSQFPSRGDLYRSWKGGPNAK
jgi:uncharacterized protein YabE (DUF348 family)